MRFELILDQFTLHGGIYKESEKTESTQYSMDQSRV